MWQQTLIELPQRARGFHLVTREILAALPGIGSIRVGMAHFFIQHTSASLAISENADPDVRRDLETHFRRLVPDDATYVHDAEGPDDMPAHLKNVIIGSSLSVPIRAGSLALGTWQGLYLCEHRDRGGPRTVLATLHGEGE